MAIPRLARPVVGTLVALALVGTPAAGLAASNSSSTDTTNNAVGAGTDTTSREEAARVDRFPTPKPETFDCTSVVGVPSECGTVKLPLDYDNPKGAKTEVAYLRVKATDQKNKIGTLFLNPGGPGGSGVDIASYAPGFLSPSLLERFDIVGFDPRGVNFSDNVQCFKNLGEQDAALAGLAVPFPFTKREENAYLQSAKKFGVACSTTGKPLSAHMSTANVARDMDVMRRVMGDKKLTYLGFSYGTYLGNVYGNLYPDRVRAVTIDGVLDPVAWAGTPATQRVPVTQRIRSGEGGTKATNEILRLCKKAGPDYCQFASKGDPKRNYAKIIAALKKQPVQIVDPDTGEVFFELDYPTLVNIMLSDLYSPFAPEVLDSDLTFIYELIFEPAPAGSPATAEQDKARTALIEKYKAHQAEIKAAKAEKARQASELGFGFPYDNSPEAYQTVLCTDSVNPYYVGNWPTYADRADSTAPGFGRLWTWQSAPCAEKYWTVRDGDAYRGRFTARTANPVLVVGNYWDPATNYDGAVAAASLLPNSRLLSSTNFGHTAYGTSQCVTSAIDTYLLTSKVPPRGKTCRSDFDPFSVPYFEGADLPQSKVTTDRARREEEATVNQELPPVVPPLPGAIPRG